MLDTVNIGQRVRIDSAFGVLGTVASVPPTAHGWGDPNKKDSRCLVERDDGMTLVYSLKDLSEV